MKRSLVSIVTTISLVCSFVPSYALGYENTGRSNAENNLEAAALDAGTASNDGNTNGNTANSQNSNDEATETSAETSKVQSTNGAIAGAQNADNEAANSSVQNLTSTNEANTVNTLASTTAENSGGINVYRLYNPVLSEHLFTTDLNEMLVLSQYYGWNYEGTGWQAPTTGKAVYRLYNDSLSQHLFTSDSNEIWVLTTQYGWNVDNGGNPLFYSAENDNGTPYSNAVSVYRLYNESLGSLHLLTTDFNEYNTLPVYQWSQEGVAFYAQGTQSDPEPSPKTQGTPILASAQVNGQSVNGSQISGSSYLFLPATANPSSVTLSFTTDGTTLDVVKLENSTTGASVVVRSGDTINLLTLGFDESNNTCSLTASTLDGTHIAPLTIMKSASILTMFVISSDPSENRAWVESSDDHSNAASATMVLVEPDGTVRYGDSEDADNNAITIKGRGNSTWSASAKKPYQIKLSKKTDLLSTGDKANKAKKWVLLTNSFDATLLHNSIALDLAAELGLSVTPQYEPVDLIYDGEYRGSYLLTEKVEVGSGRIDENDLDDANEAANPDVDLDSLPTNTAVNKYGVTYQYVEGVASPEDYSGCYLIEEQYPPNYLKSEKSWFAEEPDGYSFNNYSIISPEFCSKDEACYISEFFGEAIECANNNGISPTTGKKLSDYFDLDSIAALYIVQELSKNADACASSTYFYKPAGEDKLYGGSAWDFDCSFGTRTYDGGVVNAYAYHGYLANQRGIFAILMQCQEFRTTVANMYVSKANYAVNNVLLSSDSSVRGAYLKSIVAYADEISASEPINQIIYGLVSITTPGFVCEAFPTWRDNLTYLTNYTKWRNQWICKQMTSWLKADGHEIDDQGNIVNYDYHNYEYDGVDYSLVFDLDYYLENNPDVVAAGFTSFEDAFYYHFFTYGMAEGRRASANFDINAYINNYEDLRTAFGGDLYQYYRHYCEYGFTEGRSAL